MLRNLFVVVLLLHLCGDSTAQAPITSWQIKNESDSLLVKCSSEDDIYFIYPQSSGDKRNTSTVFTNKTRNEDGSWEGYIWRPELVYGDTGWYGCSSHPLNAVTSLPDNDPNLQWNYVFVESKTNLFVEDALFDALHKNIGGTIVIPCRPTSPNLTVTLLWGEDIPIEEDSRISFDPRIGFTLTNLTLLDSEYYTCTAELDGIVQEVKYHLNVIPNHRLDEPKIIEDTLRHVTRGQTLHVNCTVNVDVDMQYILNWTTPHESSRITTRLYNSGYSENVERVTNELTIRNVSELDEGYYKCTIANYNNQKQTQRYIKIHDPQNKFINLSSQDPNRHYSAYYGQKVQWVVYVHGYPQPRLKWLSPKGDEISATWLTPDTSKYAVNITNFSTILRINQLHLDDSGVYTVQASNDDRIEMLNFTLDVLTKPISIIEGWKSYYALNETVEILCRVAAFPEPNITWSFVKCPNYPSCEGGQYVTFLGTMEQSTIQNSFNSKAIMTFDSSGKLTCTGCNSVGCDSVTESVFVSDANGGFGIIDPEEPVTEGDDWELICASSVYNYSSYFVWTDINDTLISETNRLSIKKGQTQFTYRSILKIKNVTLEDSKYYVCSGKTMDNAMETAQYHLKVYAAQAPSFLETNLQKEEMIIDYVNEGRKKTVLKCFADGMPKPKITWYKDDTILATDDQLSFLHNNQVLEIKYLMESDSGKYTCRVENRVGKLEASQQIRIKGKEQSKGLIISIVILIIVGGIMMVYFTIKVRRERIMRKELMEAGLMHFEEGAVECLNPDLPVDDQADLLPYDKKWEFPREKLKLGKQLGSGAFGVVLKAEAEGICENEAVTTVAVKMVRRTTNATYVRALASELKIMIHLGKHLNVVNLLGACTKNISKRELLVIVEYCRFGNLHNYLLRHRSDFINQIDPATGKFDPSIGADLLTRTLSVCSNNSINRNSATDSVQYQGTAVDSQGVSTSPDGLVLSNGSTQPGWRSNYRGDYKDYNLKPICTQDLLSWAFQVARGMEYLSQRKVLHGDLAARNILLAENNIVKICDFGLAKSMYKDDSYKKKGDSPLPIKWLAIESIRDRLFSTQSDIWSFGIVLWEFFTLAETPYPGMEAEIQYQKLIEGYRMEQPEYAIPEVYDIMLRCWKAKPSLRPSFTELVESIGDLLEESVRSHYISLNAPYLDMNTLLLEGGKNDYLTMMSAPDHTILSSPTHEYVNSPVPETPGGSEYLCMSLKNQRNESDIFSPRSRQERSHFDFSSPATDSEDAVEMSPMLKKVEDDDPYLKPINIHERRAEFAKNWKAMKNNQTADRSADRDCGYYKTPKTLQLIDLNKKNNESSEKAEINSNPTTKKDFTPPIIRTQDNYVNMPKQKIDLQKDLPDGFSNPSYVIMTNREVDQTKV